MGNTLWPTSNKPCKLMRTKDSVHSTRSTIGAIYRRGLRFSEEAIEESQQQEANRLDSSQRVNRCGNQQQKPMPSISLVSSLVSQPFRIRRPQWTRSKRIEALNKLVLNKVQWKRETSHSCQIKTRDTSLLTNLRLQAGNQMLTIFSDALKIKSTPTYRAIWNKIMIVWSLKYSLSLSIREIKNLKKLKWSQNQMSMNRIVLMEQMDLNLEIIKGSVLHLMSNWITSWCFPIIQHIF